MSTTAVGTRDDGSPDVRKGERVRIRTNALTRNGYLEGAGTVRLVWMCLDEWCVGVNLDVGGDTSVFVGLGDTIERLDPAEVV